MRIYVPYLPSFMTKKWIVYLFGLLISFSLQAQPTQKDSAGIFSRITRELSAFQIDTTVPPADRTTKIIRKLSALRGGFNINEAIAYKIQEDRTKKERPESELIRLQHSFSAGEGRRWLDNAVVHIYRSTFSYRELKKLVRFYRSSAGRRMADVFPLLMLKSLMAAQLIQQRILDEPAG